MTMKGYTDVILLIDKSGSMAGIKSAVIEGVNSFIKDQKSVDGKCDLTLIQFDDEYEVNYIAKNIKDAEYLNNATYVPRGWTALYDAIAKTIIETGNRYLEMNEADRPDKIIFMIQTDGYENKSKEYKDVAVISNMVKVQTDKYSWEFVFLGANLDAKATALDLGIKSCNAMTFGANDFGATKGFESLSSNLRGVRCGDKADMSYTSTDYMAQDMAGVTNFQGMNTTVDPVINNVVAAKTI